MTSDCLVCQVLPKYNIILLKGSVPGCTGTTVRIRDSNHPKLGFKSPPPFPTVLPSDAKEGDDEKELLCAEALELPAVKGAKEVNPGKAGKKA
jgi:hypothetical protein